MAGDLCDGALAKGPFGLIDAFGVLHHLEEPLAGLHALASRLAEGGILRVMVYSRYARQEEESIRHALHLLRVREPEQVLRMVKGSKKESRLRRFFDSSDEVADRNGLADALLHPCVRTFRIDPFMELVAACGLEPLLFAHPLALPQVELEVARIRELEAKRHSPGNFILYLGRAVKGSSPDGATLFRINPCLLGAISRFCLGSLQLPGRLGHRVDPLNATARRFLRRFRHPVLGAELSCEELALANRYSDQLFLLRYRE
jgi:hypothetical protein